MNPFRTHDTGRVLVRWLRLALLALLVLGLSPLPELTPGFAPSAIQTVEAKKSKKGRPKAEPAPNAAKPSTTCQFTKSGAVWTLKSDCTTGTTILLPAGVTLNGAGKTFTMKGPAAGFARRVQLTRFGQGIP